MPLGEKPGSLLGNLIFKCDTQERVQTYRCVSQPIYGNKTVHKRLVPLLLRLIV